MKLYVDADGCPVVGQVIEAGKRHGLEVVLLCDTAHQLEREGATTITVSKGADSVDFRLVNLVEPGDIVVTQDYGLAAMCLARKALVLNQNGMEYTAKNIDSLLLARHTARKIRSAGGRLRGPAKRTREQNQAFVEGMERLLVRQLGRESE